MRQQSATAAVTPTRLYDGDTFTHRGYMFSVTFPRDEHMGEPWTEHDGHGPVSEWTTRDKGPGERVLAEDGGSRRYYDFAEAIRIAKRDQWGPLHCRYCGEEAGGIGTSFYGTVHKYGPTGAHAFTPESKGKQAARAVEADYQYCKDWCEDRWEWLGVVVTLADPPEVASLWGIESLSEPGYFVEVAVELADEILSRVEVESPDVQLSEN